MAKKLNIDGSLRVPCYEIHFDGKEIDKYYGFIREISYESHMTGSDVVKIYMQDPDLSFISDLNLFRGKTVEIYGGWAGNRTLSKWLKGYVSMIDVKFGNTGTPVVTVHCMDESFIMDRFENTETHKDTTFKQLAKKFADRYGLEIHKDVPNTTKVHESLSQSNESDIQFLIRVADKENLIVKVLDGKILWRKKGKFEHNNEEFAWNKPPFTLQSFNPRVVVADREEVKKEAEVDPETNEIKTAEADDSTDREHLGTNSTVNKKVEYYPKHDIYLVTGDEFKWFEGEITGFNELRNLDIVPANTNDETNTNETNDTVEVSSSSFDWVNNLSPFTTAGDNIKLPKADKDYNLESSGTQFIYADNGNFIIFPGGEKDKLDASSKGADKEPSEDDANKSDLKKETEFDYKNKEFIIQGHAKITVPKPSIRAGKLVTFKGLGTNFSGDYLLKSVTHNIDMRSGYTQELSVMRNAVGINDDSTEPPAKRGNREVPERLDLDTKNKVAYHKVEQGDTLFGIAKKYYGNGQLYTRILSANPQLSENSTLRVGQELKVVLEEG